MTNPVEELNGVWVEFAEGIEVCLARNGNRNYRKVLRQLTRPHLDIVRRVNLATEEEITDDPELQAGQELLEDILKEVRANTILLGWRNIQDDNGDIEYSPEKALEFFKDPRLHDFYKFVIFESSNADNFRVTKIEEAAKNLSNSSTSN